MSEPLQPIVVPLFPWLSADVSKWVGTTDRLPHALLVDGPPGIGKSALAERLSQAWLCERRRPDGDACGHCDGCRWVRAGTHPDLRRVLPEVDDPEAAEAARAAGRKPSREIRIDQVRAAAAFLTIGAHRAGRRVVVVDPADALNVVAANGLLKTLEEPSPGAVLVLVASRAARLPATLRSRCVRVALPSPPRAAVLGWLVAETGLEPGAAEAALQAAGDSPALARSLARPELAAAHRAVVEALAGMPETAFVRVADGLAKLEAAQWYTPLQRWVADLARVDAGAPPRFHPAHAARLSALARRSDGARLAGLHRHLAAARPLLEHPLNARLFCEDTLRSYAACFD